MRITGLLLSFSLAATLLAQEPASQPAPAPAPATAPSADKDRPLLGGELEKRSVTEHELTIGARTLKYRATAAGMPLKDESGKPKATMFFVAYEKLGVSDPGRRPIMFVFNGGPGAASIWLHLGALGPRRVELDEQGLPLAPPSRVVDNPDTWLDSADLVFIDPVATGFSRPAPGEAREQFFGLQEDIRWVGEFIRLYLTRYQRWGSPKFLAGESYGTTRAAGLSQYLLDRYGMSLNGIVLISSVLDFQTLQPGQGNDLPYVLYLPSYTAIAWYHKRLEPALQQADLPGTLREVEAWSRDTYLPALVRGGSLPAEQRQEIVRTLARYTSLPADFIDRADLRIGQGQFQKQLLADQRKVIGRFDGRITGVDPQPAAPTPDYDPSLSMYLGAYSTAFNAYIRTDLKFESDLAYESLTDRVQPWNFGRGAYPYVVDDLRSAMVANPHLKVFVACGYFDLATPFYSATYTLDRLTLARDLKPNIVQKFYEGGHMLYHYAPARQKLKSDVAEFVQSATPATQPSAFPG